MKFKILSRNAVLISTTHGTKHPWMKGIQICSNNDHILFLREITTKYRKIVEEILAQGASNVLKDEPRPFPMKDNNEIAI